MYKNIMNWKGNDFKVIPNIQEPSYFCRIYKCNKKSANTTGYCEDHVSPLRTGKRLLGQGSAPVIRKTTR